MKDGRTIIIEDPRLQKIRNNLRLIILHACLDRKKEIREQEHNLTFNRNGGHVKASEETTKKIQDLNDEWWEIERSLRSSIVKCPICSKHDKDMIYHKKSKTWFCVEHYKIQVS